jgi:hypothetical protein
VFRHDRVFPYRSAVGGSSSTVNVDGPGATRTNATITGVVQTGDAGSTFSIYDHAGGHLVVDLAGYFTTTGNVAVPLTGLVIAPASSAVPTTATTTATGSTPTTTAKTPAPRSSSPKSFRAP